MKVLWITNMLLPEAVSKLGEYSKLKASGGWMIGAANALASSNDVELTIASVSNQVDKLQKIQGKRIVYYVIPKGKGNLSYNASYEDFWRRINHDVSPDIVHIHGTEFTHGLAYVNVCGSQNVVVSIQGLKSAYAPYYFSGISVCEIIRNITFHDLFKGTSLREQNEYKKSGKFEIELLKKVNHIIGRTSWDRARTWAINPKACYHYCNETLREEFYTQELWNYSKCNKYTIFISQASYPIKGLHQLLKAMPLVLRHFPNAKIRVAGSNLLSYNGLSGFLHFNGYRKYIKNLIRKFNLIDKIEFTGPLDAEEMRREFLKANVFVSPSSIENSPNSLGEAQIIGTPCIASYVGGSMDMMCGCENYLYRFEEIEMLAYKICEVFSKSDWQNDMRSLATKRHDPKRNVYDLINIYKLMNPKCI